jgi:hypothetical protein
MGIQERLSMPLKIEDFDTEAAGDEVCQDAIQDIGIELKRLRVLATYR